MRPGLRLLTPVQPVNHEPTENSSQRIKSETLEVYLTLNLHNPYWFIYKSQWCTAITWAHYWGHFCSLCGAWWAWSKSHMSDAPPTSANKRPQNACTYSRPCLFTFLCMYWFFCSFGICPLYYSGISTCGTNGVISKESPVWTQHEAKEYWEIPLI